MGIAQKNNKWHKTELDQQWILGEVLEDYPNPNPNPTLQGIDKNNYKN